MEKRKQGGAVYGCFRFVYVFFYGFVVVLLFLLLGGVEGSVCSALVVVQATRSRDTHTHTIMLRFQGVSEDTDE